MHAVFTMVATAVESVPAFEHTDAAFTADAPALPATEPALAFIRASRGRLRTSPRQDHPSDATVGGGLFIARGCESTITGGQVRRATDDRAMPIERGRPQRGICRARGVHLVARNDLMLRFLDGNQLPKFIGRRDLPLRIVSVCGSKMLSTLSGT